ncbi:YozE family protein [Vagococcus intermedius]|uniref:UPF0346 protein OL234_05140 n=1 Tax=Vagococcus intermedius TaxID=2991418 RepID=A0AAF0I496_9ENTE|nr:YozE family protein [Vagococcus intermedius]WEG72373.1 YozE family protein [Vagococcus intermedius]WEG74461.1 YozE family protein [Vagococcus intermedius]
MTRSFYHYMLTLRDPNKKDGVTLLANNIGEDINFPKQSITYDEISNYLETDTSYLDNMDIFDNAWSLYLDNN